MCPQLQSLLETTITMGFAITCTFKTPSTLNMMNVLIGRKDHTVTKKMTVQTATFFNFVLLHLLKQFILLSFLIFCYSKSLIKYIEVLDCNAVKILNIFAGCCELFLSNVAE